MPRPKNKEELLKQSQANYDKLMTHIDGLSEEDQHTEFPEGTMNRNIRDVLGHVHHWHLLLEGWYRQGLKGEKPDMPATGYGWTTTPQLNRWIWEKYSNTKLSEARDLLKGSHDSIMEIINSHRNEELFEKKRYKWTGTTSMGAYFISATSSHYDWALKLIRRVRRYK